ncbi:MAG TPA: hypothetical protein VLL52_13695, partial [Anaerolineae bacterium]|nr:hypothetical protein [Anaerolineae bacterium]
LKLGGVPAERINQVQMSMGMTAGVLLVLAFIFWLTPRYRGVIYGVVPLLLLELVVWGGRVEIETNDPTLGFRHDDIVQFLQEDPELFRIESATGHWAPSAALLHGLDDMGGVYNPLALAPYDALRWTIGERGGVKHSYLNVKYVLADKGNRPGDGRLVLVYGDNPLIDVYENTRVLPRALFVTEVEVVADHGAAWNSVHAGSFLPTQTVVIEADYLGLVGEWPTGGGSEGEVEVVRAGINEMVYEVVAEAAGWLVLADVYYPNWKGVIDGEMAVPVIRANYTFRAVPVPAGEHEVRLSFVPPNWYGAVGVSGGTFLGLFLMWVGVGWKRRRLG